MKTPHNLRELWPEPEWPFEEQEGVGLRMQGVLSDATAFVQLMADYGCHPKAAGRIMDRLDAETGQCVRPSIYLPGLQQEQAS